ncbi:hypothetical protein Q9233_003829, partial [Columba guinea]
VPLLQGGQERTVHPENIFLKVHAPLIISLKNEEEDEEDDEEIENYVSNWVPKTAAEIEEERAIKEICYKTGKYEIREYYRIQSPQEHQSAQTVSSPQEKDKLHSETTKRDLQKGDGSRIPRTFINTKREGEISGRRIPAERIPRRDRRSFDNGESTLEFAFVTISCVKGNTATFANHSELDFTLQTPKEIKLTNQGVRGRMMKLLLMFLVGEQLEERLIVILQKLKDQHMFSTALSMSNKNQSSTDLQLNLRNTVSVSSTDKYTSGSYNAPTWRKGNPHAKMLPKFETTVQVMVVESPEHLLIQKEKERFQEGEYQPSVFPEEIVDPLTMEDFTLQTPKEIKLTNQGVRGRMMKLLLMFLVGEQLEERLIVILQKLKDQHMFSTALSMSNKNQSSTDLQLNLRNTVSVSSTDKYTSGSYNAPTWRKGNPHAKMLPKFETTVQVMVVESPEHLLIQKEKERFQEGEYQPSVFPEEIVDPLTMEDFTLQTPKEIKLTNQGVRGRMMKLLLMFLVGEQLEERLIVILQKLKDQHMFSTALSMSNKNQSSTDLQLNLRNNVSVSSTDKYTSGSYNAPTWRKGNPHAKMLPKFETTVQELEEQLELSKRNILYWLATAIVHLARLHKGPARSCKCLSLTLGVAKMSEIGNDCSFQCSPCTQFPSNKIMFFSADVPLQEGGQERTHPAHHQESLRNQDNIFLPVHAPLIISLNNDEEDDEEDNEELENCKQIIFSFTKK